MDRLSRSGHEHSMKIHFSLTHAGFVRNYEYALRHLAAQGHQIHISTVRSRNKLREQATLNRLMADFPNVKFRRWPKVEPSVWSGAALAIRSTQDYIRYLDPRYKSAKALRRRVAAKTPAGGLWFATIFAHFGAWSRRAPHQTWRWRTRLGGGGWRHHFRGFR